MALERCTLHSLNLRHANQSGPRSNANEGILHISQSPKPGALPSDVGGLNPLQRFNRRILQPLATEWSLLGLVLFSNHCATVRWSSALLVEPRIHTSLPHYHKRDVLGYDTKRHSVSNFCLEYASVAFTPLWSVLRP